MKVLADIQMFLDAEIKQDRWRSFLLGRLKKTDALLGQGYWIPCLDLPSSIFLGLNGNQRESHFLAMISSFIYLGADLLDDLHDEELDLLSHNISSADITLLSSTLLTVFPALIIDKLEIDAETKLAMHKTIAQTLLKMSTGQQQDVFLANKNTVSLGAVKQSIQDKSGEELAMGCLLAAQLAKISPSKQQHYKDFGLYFGTALQIVSDFSDLMWSKTNLDLKRGARSLPIAFCIEKLKGHSKKEFMAALRAATHNPEQLKFLKSVLVDSGSLDYLALVVEDLCQRSFEILTSLGLTEDIKTCLRNKIQSASLLNIPLGAGYEQPKRRLYETSITAR
ncbi:MAG: polyprenyl synthetase family protein [Deltaproteobacteria bacterium]|nr:polyprenyl synthetase family protein [Deltaproteobacteria bacterium]MBI2342578.1 polyprenyl synthetase family protein [Deltaproteobacteria bacterium]MBI2974583.1 polyprenyl synthetase family protein [Deltaproteobacteria bacterium]